MDNQQASLNTATALLTIYILIDSKMIKIYSMTNISQIYDGLANKVISDVTLV